MRRFFNWCASRDLIEANPAQYVAKPADEVRRERVLSDGELADVWRGLEGMAEPFAAGMKLLILTGARRSEVFEAERGELERRVAAPAGDARQVRGRPDHPAVATCLRHRRGAARVRQQPLAVHRRRQAPVLELTSRKAELDRRILAARGPTGEAMKPWRIHDLRRSVRDGLQRLGVRLEVIEAVLGPYLRQPGRYRGRLPRHQFATEASEALDAVGRPRHAAARPDAGKGAADKSVGTLMPAGAAPISTAGIDAASEPAVFTVRIPPDVHWRRSIHTIARCFKLDPVALRNQLSPASLDWFSWERSQPNIAPKGQRRVHAKARRQTCPGPGLDDSEIGWLDRQPGRLRAQDQGQINIRRTPAKSC